LKAALFLILAIALLLLTACGGNNKSTEPLIGPVVRSFHPAADTAGGTVTITGQRFAAAGPDNTVHIGRAQAQVIQASTGELVVAVPRGANSGPVSVTVNSVTGVSTDSFSVRMIPVAAPLGEYHDVCWTGEVFVAVGAGGQIATSANGRTWETRASGTENALRHVAHSAGTIVAVGSNSTLLRSMNAVSWSIRLSPAPTDADFVGVAASNSRFVAAPAHGNYVVASADGLSWNRYDLDTALTITCVDWVGRFQAYADRLWIANSMDGITWSRNASNLTLPAVRATPCSGSRSLLLKQSTVYRMSGGFLWSDVTPGPVLDEAYTDICWSDPMFYVAGDRFVMASLDGANWRKIADYGLASSVPPQVACNDSVCVVVGGFAGIKFLLWEY
jgi:hypothetical protein